MANASNGNAYIPGGGAGGGVAIAAGGATQTSGTVVFANSNGITFGNNNGTITATVTPGAAAGIAAIQAGTQTQTSGTLSFANSNGLSFGLSGSSQITGSYTVPGATVFSNSNNVTFGLAGSTVTASASANPGVSAISAGTTSVAAGAVVFSNSNGIAFGLNGSTVTGSYTVPGTTAFSNSNGVTFGLVGSTVTASYNSTSAAGLGTTFAGTNISASITLNTAGLNLALSGGGGAGGAAISAAGNSVNAGTIVFSNSNGVSFGMAGSTITATVNPGAAAGIAAVQLPNTTYTSGTVNFVNSNGLSFGSTTGGGITGSYTVPGATSFSNANGVTFGLAGSTLTASYTQSAQAFSASGGSSTFSTLAFANSNGITFSNSAGSIVGSYNSTSAAGQGTTFAGTNISASMTLNTAGLNLALSGAAGGGGSPNISAGTTSGNLGSIVFSNSNGVSFGLNGSTITASASGAGASATVNIQSQSTGQSSSSAYALSALNFAGYGIISIGNSGGTIQVSGPTTTNFANLSVSAGTTSGSLGSLVFSNSNGVSFGLNGSTITASAAGGGGGGVNAGVSNLGNTAGSTGTVSTGNVVFVGSGAISLSQSTGAAGSAATISILGPATSSLVGAGYVSISSAGSTITISGSFAQNSFFNAAPYDVTALSQMGQGTVQFYQVNAPDPFSASKAYGFASFSVQSSAGSSNAGVVSQYFGIYTRTGSSLSLASSGSQSYQFSNTSNNSFASISGLRQLSVPMNVNYTGGDIWVGAMSLTSSTANNFFTASNLVVQPTITGPIQGLIGQAFANSNQQIPGQGFFSTTSAALPASVAFSQITGSNLQLVPVMFANFTA